MDYSTNNKQFDNLFTKGDIDACFDLFKNTPYSSRSLNYHMLEKLNLNFEKYDKFKKDSLLNKYITSLESVFDIHNQMIIASIDEDLLSNKTIKNEVWSRVINANLSDKELIRDLFDTLGIRENPVLCFQLFNKYPDYGLLSELWTDYINFYDDKQKETFWKNYVSILNSSNKKAKEAVLYSLWVDFFEDASTQKESWNKLMVSELNEDGIKSLLEYSGPVDFEQKIELINQHISNSEMHLSILMSLFGSLHDVFGHISFPEARSIFNQLNIDGSNEYYDYLKEKLYKFDSQQEYWVDRNKKR